MLFCQILKTFREMEDSLHLKTEPILIFVNDFLNVMARFGITSDEELFLLLPVGWIKKLVKWQMKGCAYFWFLVT